MSLFNDALQAGGYTRVKMNDIVSALNTAWMTAFGSDFDVDPRSPDGQIIGVIAEMFSDLEGNGYGIYQGLSNPNGANGQLLTNICALNGIVKNSAKASYVPVMFSGTPGTPIPTGSLIQSTLSDGTTAKWSGIYTVSGGVSIPGATIGGGGTTANVWATCTVAGPTKCPAGTTMSLLSVITGVTGVSVVSDATVGYYVEGDANLRVRRLRSFGLASQGMADALDSALNNMPADVLQAAVWENNTGTLQVFPGGGSLDPRSIRVIVAMQPAGSNVQRVIDKIYQLKAPGCGMTGTTTGNALDEQGNAHTIVYDLATAKRVLVNVLLSTRSGWPSDGGSQIATLVGTWSNVPQNRPLGGDSAGQISWTAVLGSFVGQVPGFDLITGGMQLGTIVGGVPSWSTAGTNLPISFNQYATIAATDVYLNGVAVFP
jgi:hypothetical protein